MACRWIADERGFAMPVKVGERGKWQTIRPTTDWQLMPMTVAKEPFEVANGFVLHQRARGCPDVERLRAYQPGGASKLVDRNGREFAELRPVEAETAPLRSIPKRVT